MAFRIAESVIKGEIDNRVKGVVRGTIFLHERADPLVLELTGNAWPDLAGCLLTFTNALEARVCPGIDSLAAVQRGSIGDLTVSRKVRVVDVPPEEAPTMIRRKQTPPERLANSLYLEWFSEANGRVVIESTNYKLTISAPEWRMTPEDEQQRAKQAAAGMSGFMGKLTRAIDQHRRGQKDPEEPWDEHDYEKFLKESDARTDKYMELLDKYGTSEEAEGKIEQEMGWGQRELTEEEAEEQRRRIEEINAACEEALNEPEPEPDPHLEGIDWIRTEEGYFAHPLQHRCFESATRFWKAAENHGLDMTSDKDLEQFIFEFQTTAAKLAGALGCIARGIGLPDPAFTVACLKRALDHLHKAQAGLEAVAPKKILPEGNVIEARKELFEIREAILQLMDKFRGRLQE